MKGMGERLFNLRKNNGLSQEELAEKVGVSRQTVYKWEADKVQPTHDKIEMLCELFCVSANYLLGETCVSESPDNSEVIEMMSRQNKKINILITSVIVLGILLTISIVVTIVVGSAVFGDNKTNSGNIYEEALDVGYFWLTVIITSVLFITDAVLIIILYKSKYKKPYS